ncbi:nuclear transport factor 2 family protein [Acidicapsa acidisoli]|uniref:nuclear transport factor 2 family protein n=1 Tax=Acidicapsa acidisoli TaxID=1615681 RepID=UPI0021DFA97A|nr:nuclear transport factor 2 family protein [Acidicapsa acidisoli]
MSIEKNVQVVRNFLAALGSRDKQGLLALAAEDIEWIVPGENWPLAGTHRGHAGLENLLQKANETVETSYPEPPRVHSAERPGPGHRRRYWENQSHE